MPLVFIHGVATRSSPGYAREIAQRDAMFRAAILDGLDPGGSIFKPAWGDLVPGIPRLENPIIPLPGAGIQPLSDTGREESEVRREVLDGAGVLALARRSLVDAVDALFAARIQSAPQAALRHVAADALCAARYARENPFPDWIHNIRTGDDFVTQLMAVSGASAAAESTGTAQPALEAAGFLDWPADVLLKTLRPSFTSAMTLFFGDVFSYLANRGDSRNPGPIPTLIMEALDNARAEADTSGRPLIIVGHSMGGNIAYDVLSHYRTELSVESLVTVGSQASLLRQLDVFHVRDPRGQPKRALKPPGVARWINIVDHHDALAFLFEPEFEGVVDREYRTDAGITGAHTSYFARASFFERLAAYLNVAK
jgi:hypothetical protein